MTSRPPSESVYEAAEDTELLLAVAKGKRGQRVLDLGTGSGAIALQCARAGARVTATDINPAALEVASSAARTEGLAINFALGDLFSAVSGRFDLIVFNPPYLPTGPDDLVQGALHAAFDGGPDGLRVTRRFMRELPRHLRPGGRALVVVSSLSPWPRFVKAVPRGFVARVIRSTRVPFEDIRVVELTRAPRKGSSTRTGGSRSLRGRRSARSGSPRAMASRAKGSKRLALKARRVRRPNRRR